MFRKIIPALLAPVLVLAAACGDDESASGRSDLEVSDAAAVAALRAAPDAAADAGSSRFEMVMVIDGPEGAFEITSTGAIDGDRVAMKMDLGSGLAGLAEAEGEALPPGFDQPMEIVIDGATAFLRMPMLDAISGTSGWLSATGEELAAGGSAFGLTEGSTDPSQIVELLRGTGDDLTEEGREDVRGVATTHYSVLVDLAQAFESVPAEQRSVLEAQIEGFDIAAEQIPVDVWVDDEGLVRRFKLDLSELVGAVAAGDSAVMTIEMFDYGADIDIEVPALEDTTPLADVMGGLGMGALG